MHGALSLHRARGTPRKMIHVKSRIRRSSEYEMLLFST